MALTLAETEHDVFELNHEWECLIYSPLRFPAIGTGRIISIVGWRVVGNNAGSMNIGWHTNGIVMIAVNGDCMVATGATTSLSLTPIGNLPAFVAGFHFLATQKM